ncbi:autotransporter outer membrane beta-barrel domain-containing protein [Hydrogenophaga sp.]|uniref:autotransporter outer membrane beta-barrel domain-containing protein n=1 Tax=Hydrogenophaga sp. TaxID=1904254 RepID=UPI0027265E21|nr:autotransporter outer membrane beta-barrel domain-containing protein [Hydrogenophaga sp.]MDO9436676.1 autotransporter outer membrane beta-barrel domain-containing protein [Hydrogenophaga sp.]
MKKTPGRGTATFANRHSVSLCALSTLAACLLTARVEAAPGVCAPDADVTFDCTSLVINNPNQTITVGTGVNLATWNWIGVWIKPTATNITFINNGTISSNEETLFNQGSITEFINNGSITGGIHFYNQATIGTLTNMGTITGFRSIYNTAPLHTLNNRQGGNSPLVMSDSALPANYNIIILSPSDYGKLSAPSSGGSTNFGIYTGSVVAPGTYEDVLSGLSPAQLNNTSGTYGQYAWTLNFDGVNYDLVFAAPVQPGPTAIDTQSAMRSNAIGLRSAFAVQTAYLNPGLSYDCALFDSKGVCVAASGRSTSVQGAADTAVSGIVTLSYRVRPTLRLGGYVEQTLNETGDANVRIHRGNPDVGLFAVWNAQPDGDGPQIRLAHRQGQKKVDITRPVVASSEPGSGTADLTSRGTQLTLSHGVRVNDTWRISPYVGVRAIQVQRGAYNETASAAVTAPLSYGKLEERSTAVLLGSHFAGRLAPRFTLTGFLGLEHDQSRKSSDYGALGVTALQSFDFNDKVRKTRPVASLGFLFDVDKTHQLSAQWVYRKEAFTSTATNTALVTYAVGF